jgi:transcription antitermination factor NusG
LIVSIVQAYTLPPPESKSVWEGQRVVITKGHFKGYHGFVKDENDGKVDVDLDAKLASFGRTTTRIPIGDVVIECVLHTHTPP